MPRDTALGLFLLVRCMGCATSVLGTFVLTDGRRDEPGHWVFRVEPPRTTG
jgi:hypothetical protein